MAEYCEKKALIREIISDMTAFVGSPDAVQKHDEQCNYAISCVENAPAADVAPVVHGRWEYTPETINVLSQTRCSGCGWWTLDPSVDGVYHYCPNCGAKMDEYNESEN